MCSPDLKVKAKKAMEVLLSDDEKEDKSRDSLKVMNYITGTNEHIKNTVLQEADTRYVAKP